MLLKLLVMIRRGGTKAVEMNYRLSKLASAILPHRLYLGPHSNSVEPARVGKRQLAVGPARGQASSPRVIKPRPAAPPARYLHTIQHLLGYHLTEMAELTQNALGERPLGGGVVGGNPGAEAVRPLVSPDFHVHHHRPGMRPPARLPGIVRASGTGRKFTDSARLPRRVAAHPVARVAG